MRIYLSNSDWLGNIDGFFTRLDLSNPNELYIETHPKWISIHPAILTLTAALALKVGKENVVIDAVTARSGHYLDRMGLYDLIGKDSPFDIDAHEEAGRFIPLTIIKNASEQSAFISDMIPLLHLPPERADAIKYVISELVRNVLEHAHADDGAVVAAQYYPKSNTVRIGICDTGIGIRESMSPVWNPQSDLQAMLLALKPGITGTTKREGGTEENAGAGLFFIKSLASMSRDYFLLYSGTAIYRLLKRRPSKHLPHLNTDPQDDHHSSVEDAEPFQGTLVAFDISLDETDEFVSLLTYIRTAYTSAIRERKAKRYRPKFI